jgi:hypothetical protein
MNYFSLMGGGCGCADTLEKWRNRDVTSFVKSLKNYTGCIEKIDGGKH